MNGSGVWLILLAATVSGLADSGGTISGTVADSSRAVVPEVVVVARNLETAETRGVTTDSSGNYAIVNLPGGSYEIKVAQAGFDMWSRSGVELKDHAAVTVNIELTVAQHADVVTVSESVARLDAADTQVGSLTTAARMASVPSNGRSFTDLLALQPGVMATSSQQPNAVVMSGCTSAPPSGDLNPGNLSVSGQRETANGFSVNGSSAQEDFNMGTAIVPNLDSIRDLRVLTGSFDAQFGNYGGGQVLLTTKSGTNEWHGSAFEFLRNTDLDARNYFAAERAIYQRNQFGGTIGGAIRKDRLFFFADYQGTRMTNGIDTGLIPVPSMAERSGNFSDIADSLTGHVNGQYWADLLSKKLGYGVQPGEPYYLPGCISAEQCVLPNGQIPKSAWAAPAKALLPYIPRPNDGDSTFTTSAYNQKLRDDKGAIRLDAGTRWGAFLAYYFADDYRMDNPYPTGQGGADVPGFNALSLGRAQLATASLTTTLSPTLVNELRIGYMRTANQVGQPVGGVGATLLSQGFTDGAGKPGIVALSPQIEGIENVSFNDFTMGVDTTGVAQANNTYQWSDDISKVRGKHLLKFGANVHYDQVNINPDAIYNGSFLFQGTETGSDFADFLLGIASSYSQGDSQRFYLRNHYAGVYGQDSWRVRPNLTLNFGMRWDLLPPWREKYNQLQTLDPGKQSVVYPGAPAGLLFPGDPGIPATLAPTRYNDFAPRAGLAYSSGKTTVRAGYGLSYTAIEGLSAGIMSANPPYGYDYSSFAPPLFATPFVTAASGQDAGQRFPEPIPAAGASASHPNTSVDWSQYLPITGVPSFFHQNVTPYSESYTFSVEHQIDKNTGFTLGYVGAQAHHLLVLISANPGNPSLCASLSRPDAVMPGTATCGPFGESGVYLTAAGQTINGTRGPFSSQFAAVTYQKTIGNSAYHSLEASFSHSSRTLELGLSYTYGKSLDESSSLAEAVNPLNPRLSRALSAFDMRHNFVATYSWKLPVGGLSLSGISRFTTGLPVTLYNNNDTSLLGTIPNGINNNGVDTPNFTPGNLELQNDPRGGKPAFQKDLFSLPALGQLGTAARRFFSGPGMANFDLALHKNVRVKESGTLELRLEAFNAFNHAQFYGPAAVNGNITSASFSQITAAAAPRLVQVAARFTF